MKSRMMSLMEYTYNWGTWANREALEFGAGGVHRTFHCRDDVAQ